MPTCVAKMRNESSIVIVLKDRKTKHESNSQSPPNDHRPAFGKTSFTIRVQNFSGHLKNGVSVFTLFFDVGLKHMVQETIVNQSFT